jgi:hypothetical protein
LVRRRITICSNSAGASMRPTADALVSSAPRTLPTGAVVFCARSALTTSVTGSVLRSFGVQQHRQPRRSSR